MSTRSQIAVFENENEKNSTAKVLLYRHSDGYPEGVLPDIKPFLVKFNKVRGISDAAYCFARLTQHLTNLHDKLMNKLHEKHSIGSHMEDSFCIGFGVDAEFHGDIEYFYHVSPTAIKVFEVASEDPDAWKLLKRVALPAAREVA